MHYSDNLIKKYPLSIQQLPLTQPSKVFFCSNLWFGGRQSTVTMVFTRWPREDSFPVFQALRGTCHVFIFAIFSYRIWYRFMWRLRGVRICWVLWTYLHNVSYNHVSFLNTRPQLFRVLGTAGTSGFYSKTRRMISGKQPPFRGNFFLLSVWYISFLLISTTWQIVHGSRVFMQSNR